MEVTTETTEKTICNLQTSTGQDLTMQVVQSFEGEQGKEQERQPDEIGFTILDEMDRETFMAIPVHEARAMIKGLEQLINEANKTF